MRNGLGRKTKNANRDFIRTCSQGPDCDDVMRREDTTAEPPKLTALRLAKLWPGGTLTLVKRMAAPSSADESTSVFRLSKGDDAVLIFIGSPSDRRISTLRTAPEREYDW